MSILRQKFDGLAARPAAGVKGRDYYGLACRGCGEQIAIMADSSEGALPVKIVGAAEIEVVCPLCHSVAVYLIEDMLAFRQL